jgi:hypothetical protein
MAVWEATLDAMNDSLAPHDEIASPGGLTLLQLEQQQPDTAWTTSSNENSSRQG